MPQPPDTPPHQPVALRWWQKILPHGLLERRLLLVAFAGLLPLALLSSFTLLQSTRAQKQQLIHSAQDTMRAVMTAVDTELRLSVAALEALATSPRLGRRDLEAFHTEARELLATRPNWANIALSDHNTQLMNAQMPAGMALPELVDAASVAEVFRTGMPVIGNVVTGPLVKSPAFGVFIPVRRGAEVVLVLSAVVRPDSIHAVLAQQNVPVDGVVVILDRRFNIAARSMRHGELVGTPAAPLLIQAMSQGKREGWATTVTREGLPVYAAFYRSAASGWSAAIGIPMAALDQPVQWSFAVLLGAIVVSVVAGLVAASAMGRRIVQPMRELELAAIAVGKGEAPTMPHTDLPEIQRAAAAMEAARRAQEALLESERGAKEVERQARVMAEDANQSKDQLLAMLGHELRNPLAAITAASELMERLGRAETPDAAYKQKTDRARDIISRQARHLGRIIDDLLNAGGIVTGKVQLDRRPVDLAQVVRSVVTSIPAARIEGREVTLALDSVWVAADASRIDQVVTNLVNNALKYTPAPGSIAISVGREGDEAVLCVRDSGLGMEPDLLPRVFDLFVQGSRSLDRAEGGMGIGLSVVRRLSELHGGRVQANSAGVGQGSEFKVWLPRIAAPALQDLPRSGKATPVHRKIVIVEDIEEVRSTLKEWLEIEGHEVVEAADGPAGIDAVLRERPDVALVDIGLPGADGYAVARAIRAGGGASVRLVALSGYGQPEDKARGLQAGFDAYLVKPIDPDVLAVLLAEKPRSPA